MPTQSTPHTPPSEPQAAAATPTTAKLKEGEQPIDLKAVLDNAINNSLQRLMDAAQEQNKQIKSPEALTKQLMNSNITVLMNAFKQGVEEELKKKVEGGESVAQKVSQIEVDKNTEWTAFVQQVVAATAAAEQEETPVEEEETKEVPADDPWVNQWFNAYERVSKEGAVTNLDETELDGKIVSAVEPMGKNKYDMFPVLPDAHNPSVSHTELAGDASIYAGKPTVVPVPDPKQSDFFRRVDPITGQLAAKAGDADERWIRAKMSLLRQKGLLDDKPLSGDEPMTGV